MTANHEPSMLESLPASACVLQVGDDHGALASAYQARHPASHWCAWPGQGADTPQRVDLIVLVRGWLDACDPLALLHSLSEVSTPDTELFVEMENQTQLAMVQRWVEGDLSDVDDGPLARANLRHASPASLCKLLMDAGWMASCIATTPAPPAEPDLLAAAMLLAEKSGTPAATAHRQLCMGRFVLQARRIFEPVSAPAAPARFAVVVPTTRDNQLRLNVTQSPGLREVDARIVPLREAGSPAQALEDSLAHFDAQWVLLSHQDVYFPAGFGRRLNALLAGIAPEDAARTLIGFAGMAVNAQSSAYEPAGFVIDRGQRFDHPASPSAVSIDELAIVLSRDSIHRIDPRMGWHLWATDLCLTAICEHKVFPQIVRLPLFHNSVNDFQLPAAFHASAERLAAKHAGFGPIPTLCGTIAAGAVAKQPAAATAKVQPAPRVTIDAGSPPVTGPRHCCLCERSVDAWLPHPHIGRRSEFMKLLDAVGSDLSVYQCPSCHSTDRDRHLWLYMLASGLPQRMASMRILHIAPEQHLETQIGRTGPREYVRGDLHPMRAGHLKIDVEALAFGNASFDLILCNHVLEHVASPAQALAEFHRCLSPGGVLIAQTPYAPSLLHTLELNRPVSSAFAKLFYGQEDHVRLFGADIANLFHAAGFSGDLRTHADVLGDLDAQTLGCNVREPFFCFTR